MIEHSRLWNLWDMLILNSERFLHLLRQIHEISGLLIPCEVEVPKGVNIPRQPSQTLLSVDETMRNNAAEILRLLNEMELIYSAIEANRFKQSFSGQSINGGEARERIDALYNRISDELHMRHLLLLSDKEVALFSPPKPLFGQDFQTKFPLALYELDEAAKCRALGRDTATVFHLMRILEISLNAIRICLGIPDPIKDADRNWSFTLDKLKNAIDTKVINKLFKTPGDKEFFYGLYASLDSVRIAWRNTTMHVETKYNPDEAEHIFTLVKGFMRSVSSRIDENGQPLA